MHAGWLNWHWIKRRKRHAKPLFIRHLAAQFSAALVGQFNTFKPMNHTINCSPTHIPDSLSLASEAVLAETWDSSVLTGLLREKLRSGEAPTFLLLGRREAALLRSHLAAAFGEDSVATLKGTYYMGLEIVEIDFPEFFHTGGQRSSLRSTGLPSKSSSRSGSDPCPIWRLRLD